MLHSRLVYLIGSLYSKSEELKSVLQDLEERGENQGEMQITHRTADGETAYLRVHIDGTYFTITSGDAPDFRLDISDTSISSD